MHWKWGTSVGVQFRTHEQRKYNKGVFVWKWARDSDSDSRWNWIEGGGKLGQEAQLISFHWNKNRRQCRQLIHQPNRPARVNIGYTSRFYNRTAAVVDWISSQWRPWYQGTWWIIPLYRTGRKCGSTTTPHLNEIYNSNVGHDDKMSCITGVLGTYCQWGITKK